MTIRNAFADLSQDRPASSNDAHLVSGNKVRYRREFIDPSLEEWVVETGTGQSAAAGGGSLVITAGTTPNQTTTITSKRSFSVPFKASFGFQLSSKIANVEWYVELVADNDAGGTDETIVAAWRVAGSDSTTTTNARTEVRNGNAARIQSANIASQATQTSSSIYEIVIESDETWFHSRVADSVAGRSTSSCRNTTSPDPTKKYKLRYRCVTGSTAPASSTTLTSSFCTAVDYTEFNMEITGGQGSNSAGQAIPVYTTGAATTNTTATLTASATATAGLVGKVLSAASTNATLVKSSQARLISYSLTNTSASTKFVKFFNKTTAPVPGTDVPVFTLAIPAGQAVTYSPQYGLTFATGLGYSITGGLADNDTTAVAVGDVIGHVNYI